MFFVHAHNWQMYLNHFVYKTIDVLLDTLKILSGVLVRTRKEV